MLLLASSSAAFGQQRAPTDLELHAAYCIPLMQKAVQTFATARETLKQQAGAAAPGANPESATALRAALAEAERSLAERQAALDRLQRYLTPRIASLDPAALQAAMHGGEGDARYIAQQAAQCMDRKNERNCLQAADAASCVKQCVGLELSARLEQCRQPSWLP